MTVNEATKNQFESPPNSPKKVLENIPIKIISDDFDLSIHESKKTKIIF